MYRPAISYYFKRISLLLEKGKSSIAEDYGITQQQLYILLFLNMKEDGSVYQKTIEDFFGLSNATVSGIITRMEKQKIVTKKIVEHNKKNKYVFITEKGREIIADVRSRFYEDEKDITSGMSDEDKERLYSYLEIIMDNLVNKEGLND